MFYCPPVDVVSTHSRLKAAGMTEKTEYQIAMVSTHSRLKAAGPRPRAAGIRPIRFNTQPPKGGWDVFAAVMDVSGLFQHTAA